MVCLSYRNEPSRRRRAGRARTTQRADLRAGGEPVEDLFSNPMILCGSRGTRWGPHVAAPFLVGILASRPRTATARVECWAVPAATSYATVIVRGCC